MAQEFYGYFDSATGDARSYASEQLAKVFRALAADGVSAPDGLQVQAEGSTMRTTVSPGLAILRGYVYELIDDGGAVKAFTHEPSGTAARIDRVVVKLDMTARTVQLYVKVGTPGANPAAPTLQNTGSVREISLARVTVRASADAIASGDVIDERFDEAACGACVPPTLKRSALDARYGSLASAQSSGLISASQYSGLAALLSALSVNSTRVDIGGRYLDNALFR